MAEVDAIQEDVLEAEEKPEEKQPEPLLTQQQMEMERIASERDAQILKEFEEEEEVVVEEPPEAMPGVPLNFRDGEWYAVVKVNGEEREIPWNDALTDYQKNSSADQRLQEAAQRYSELQDYERKLNQYRSQLEAQNQSQPSSDAGESPSSDAVDALYSEYHDALFQGDEAKSSNLLKQIRSAERPNAPTVDVAGIIERTKTEMREEEKQAEAARYETRRKDAVQKFRQEYSELVDDPSLLAVADARSAELYQANPTRDPWDIMQECGEYAREWLMKYVDQLGGKTTKDERRERKQDMDEVAPRNVRSNIGEDQTMPTASDIIAEMRKDRGQYS